MAIKTRSCNKPLSGTPRRTSVGSRYNVRTRSQKAGERVQQYRDKLRKRYTSGRTDYTTTKTTKTNVSGVKPSNNKKKNIYVEKEAECSGYNSSDEHTFNSKDGKFITEKEWNRRDKKFCKLMAERGFKVKNVKGDGACLFRAIALQIYGDEGMHDIIRQNTMDYIYENREYFGSFVTEDINSYIERKRRKHSHGNHIEIQAISEIYCRPVEVYCYEPTPINIVNSEQLANGYAPLRLSYQRDTHYNAILDENNATVVDSSVQNMFEGIEEQIACKSFLKWCRTLKGCDNETTAEDTDGDGSSDKMAVKNLVSWIKGSKKRRRNNTIWPIYIDSWITETCQKLSSRKNAKYGNNKTSELDVIKEQPSTSKHSYIASECNIDGSAVKSVKKNSVSSLYIPSIVINNAAPDGQIDSKILLREIQKSREEYLNCQKRKKKNT